MQGLVKQLRLQGMWIHTEKSKLNTRFPSQGVESDGWEGGETAIRIQCMEVFYFQFSQNDTHATTVPRTVILLCSIWSWYLLETSQIIPSHFSPTHIHVCMYVCTHVSGYPHFPSGELTGKHVVHCRKQGSGRKGRTAPGPAPPARRAEREAEQSRHWFVCMSVRSAIRGIISIIFLPITVKISNSINFCVFKIWRPVTNMQPGTSKWWALTFFTSYFI